ncbi:hypothetical protein ACFW9X_03170 [Streptomyces sp. NPDC059466]|uniref:hypothetical protein n=1 Tax=Streptomyces sp. NPDC059466 TaxID=3346843 RepID=UPI0036B337DD
MPEQETATNVRTGETVTAEVPTPDEAYIASLRRERAAYVTYGRDDRVKAVDDELARWNVAPEDDAPASAPRETAAESKPRRTARSAKG